MSKSKRLLWTPSVAKSVTNCLPNFSGCFELGLSSNLWEKYQNLSAWCSTIVIDACETPKTGIFLWRKWARGGGGASRELFNESPWERKIPTPANWVDGFVRFPSFPDWKFTELGSFWVHIARRGFKPGVTAVHLRLQPVCVPLPSVWKKMLTVLVRVVMIGGRKYLAEVLEPPGP